MGGRIPVVRAAYFSLKFADRLEPSSVVMVTVQQVPGFLGVCQFWMNCPPVES
ncbi:MAG: hypothetical protein V9F04_17920 [Dermatophilaceae bacterium]